MRNLSAQCEENKLELANIGGIDAVVTAMQVHRDISGIQEAGAWALSNMAGNVDVKVLIGDCRNRRYNPGNVGPLEMPPFEWSCAYTCPSDRKTATWSYKWVEFQLSKACRHTDSSVVQEMGAIL
jgi:hypothetical protein